MEWIIAGGGIHGCTIATYLIKAKGIPASQICIIDPHKGPIEKWKDLTSRIAMPFLRSPSVHHCDIHPFSLHYFNDGGSDVFYGKYKRPGLDFFNHHSEAIFTSIGLQERWQQGRVQRVTKSGNHWVVETDSGEFAATMIGGHRMAELDSGFVYTLATLPLHRGRGLAKALLHRAMHDAAEAGYGQLHLTVDAANPTGAVRLYESVGMRARAAFSIYGDGE